MQDIYVQENITIKQALRKLDNTAEKVLLVIDDEKNFVGTLTDGDVRRCIINGVDLEDPIKAFYNKTPKFISQAEASIEKIREILLKYKIALIPIIDNDQKVVEYYTWDSVFSKEQKKFEPNQIDIPVVIMAGGKGSRMEPFTHVLPKPLIPINDTPIMDIIIEKFRKFGVQDFFATLNFKGKMIEVYYNGFNKNFNMNYVWEKEYSGTAGSLAQLKNKLHGTFIVSNCDIIVNADYFDVIEFHRKKGASMTVISAIQHHKIPYGVFELSNGGEITSIQEKPEYTFTINTGVYILEKDCLEYIPENQIFHMTSLIEALIKDDKGVYTYPVNENDYIDIGQWDEYRLASSKLRLS